MKNKNQTTSPQVIVSPCGQKVRVIWADGAEESAAIPESTREHVMQALEHPDYEFGRDGMTNKDFALLVVGIL